MHRVLRTAKRLAIAGFILLGIYALYPSPAWAQSTDDTAQATIYSTSDLSEVIGEATFTETLNGLKIDVKIDDAPPGYHGFHIHENGSCDDGGQAAGGHFNPENVKHGRLITDGFDLAHAGDLGNIYVYEDGTGILTQVIRNLPLTEGKRAVAGKAVILHADRDDYGQPTGNADGRIGCGIISLAD